MMPLYKFVIPKKRNGSAVVIKIVSIITCGETRSIPTKNLK
jgi:hypothetical protein